MVPPLEFDYGAASSLSLAKSISNPVMGITRIRGPSNTTTSSQMSARTSHHVPVSLRAFSHGWSENIYGSL